MLTAMGVQPYDHQRDLAAVQRIWEDCRWVTDDDDKAAMVHFLQAADAWVARIDGQAECLVGTVPGRLRYQATDLPLAVVAGVTTSLVGRKQQLAGRVTATALGAAARAGAAVSVLGMFEQGFYDRLGFGTGSYDHVLTLDPATLRVDLPTRRPVRLTVEDWQEVHDCLMSRVRGHGGVVTGPAGLTRAEMAWTETPFGLGLRDDEGTLTGLVWGEGKGENGPFTVTHLAHRTPTELLEVLGLLRSLDDQVRSVKLTEPVGVQLQDVIRHVGRQEIAGKGASHGFRHEASAWWQIRILDLQAAVAACRLDGPAVRFCLQLSDPLDDLLHDPLGRAGSARAAGSWVVTLGPASSARRGSAGDLPTLTASVNAFSRMWLGVRPASVLSLTDDLAGPPGLLDALDRVLAPLPTPHPGLDF